MQNFSVYCPTRIYFGADHLEEFATRATEIGSKALLVTGGGSVERLGYQSVVVSALTKAGVELEFFSGIEPNPHASTIDRAAAENTDKGIETIIALGGGSVMDASKAIGALLATGEEKIWPFVLGESRHTQLSDSLPIIAIPTTAATASEVTPYAVISNPDTNGKAALAYEFFKPKLSWINPEFTTEIPVTTTCDGAADILSHVLENYLLGGDGSPLTDRYCEGVMLTVMETLPKLLEQPKSVELRAQLMWCSTMALNGLHWVGREPSEYILHTMEHAASGFNPKLAHGRGLATLFPAYFRYLWEKDRARGRLAKLGAALFGIDQQSDSAGLQCIEQFENWLRQNDLLQSMPDVGISKELYEKVAEYAISLSEDGKGYDILGPFGVSDVISIFELTETQKRG